MKFKLQAAAIYKKENAANVEEEISIKASMSVSN